ncbi:MAG TPA: histidinol dehydrogenase, partial [Candidatus Acidoferrum sp.]
MTVRIITLTPATEKALLKARETEDREALAVAARIVGDVRSGGDKALQAWTQKLDRIDLAKSGPWVSPSEFAAAQKKVSREFLRATKHAANNIRRVAEKQSPCDWNLRVEPGVTIQQIVRPLESIGCYIPGGR